jgi:hypothetical protein
LSEQIDVSGKRLAALRRQAARGERTLVLKRFRHGNVTRLLQSTDMRRQVAVGHAERVAQFGEGQLRRGGERRHDGQPPFLVYDPIQAEKWFRVHGSEPVLKFRGRPVFESSPAWRGATKENIPCGSSTEKQQSQGGLDAKTLRAAALLSVDFVGSFLTARCGDARNSPSRPRPKSSAAGPLAILRQALILPSFGEIQVNAIGQMGRAEKDAHEQMW